MRPLGGMAVPLLCCHTVPGKEQAQREDQASAPLRELELAPLNNTPQIIELRDGIDRK